MEVLTLMLQHATSISSDFRFHYRCEKQRIVNLCFADDLFRFSHGDVTSCKVLVNTLDDFRSCSGLVPSASKSTAYFANVSDVIKDQIKQVIPFVEGSLPVRYLGVPLITSRLTNGDCAPLLERFDRRIMDWKNRSLSFAGRVQLINSVLASFSVFWGSVFKLPVAIIKDIEKRMRNFLWSQGVYSAGKAKVAWSSVCKPRKEGGLGIRRVSVVNNSLLAFHVHSIVSSRPALWVEWVRAHHIKHHSFWEIDVPSSCTWSWRSILKTRPFVRQFIWSKIGNGKDTSAWFETWCHQGPLGMFITPRNIHNAGLNMQSKVADCLCDGGWVWPPAWYDLYPVLNQVQPIELQPEQRDVFLWNSGDSFTSFASVHVWNMIRSHGREVDWWSIVWSAFNVPRHAFILWLIFRKKLVTQDRLLEWNRKNNGSMNLVCCLLCKEDIDSHEHLFFKCKYAKEVWSRSRSKACIPVGDDWVSIINGLQNCSRPKSFLVVSCKLLLAATTYFVWQERNARFFNNQLRPPEKLVDIIISTVKLKIKTLRFKKSTGTSNWLRIWDIEADDVDYT